MPTDSGKFGSGGARPSGFQNASGTNGGGGGAAQVTPRGKFGKGGGGKHHQKNDAGTTPQRGSLINDLQFHRMGTGYMHNPAYKSGAEQQDNKPKQLPSQHIVEHGDDDHAIAHEHMDNARKAKTTDEKRKHVFKSLQSLNRAKKRGY